MLHRIPALLAALALGLWLWRADAVVEGCAGAPGEVSGAERFEPVIDPGPFDAPDLVLVRATWAGPGEVSFLYYFSWKDERHPQGVLDRPYTLFRRLLYGSVEDLEYVRVLAEVKTGKVLSVEFEAPETGAVFVGHVFRKLEGEDIPLYMGRPALRIASWNHLFEPGAPCTQYSSVSVVPLSLSVCRSLSVPLRSHPPKGNYFPRPGVSY